MKVDVSKIERVILNLVSNAIKFSNDNESIYVTINSLNKYLEIIVEDNGIGIAPRDLKMIFERFYRVSTGNRHDVKGFGLGLSYVKTIVEAHGGRVSAESQEGKGTRFDILLPLMNSNIGS